MVRDRVPSWHRHSAARCVRSARALPARLTVRKPPSGRGASGRRAGDERGQRGGVPARPHSDERGAPAQG